MVGRLRSLLGLALLIGAVACSKRTPEPAASVAAKTAPTAKQAEAAEGDEKLAASDPRHGTRRLMGLDAPVFVDGTQVGVLRAGEMPPIQPFVTAAGTTRWRLYDYLRGLGIAPESLKSVHLHGNNDRIASIEGAELLKDKDRFAFKFLSGDSGVPVQTWSTTGLKNAFVIHEIRRVTVYVKKPSPAIHPERQCHVDAAGACTDAIPYADGAIAKGTRIYVDGKMMGFVKRRSVGDDLIVAQNGETTSYALTKLLAQLGADPAGAKAVELIAGDAVIGRATGEQLTALASKTTFALAKHSHGKVNVHVPAELQAREGSVTDKDAMVSAILVHKHTQPSTRELVAISEDTNLSVQLASATPEEAAPDKLGQ